MPLFKAAAVVAFLFLVGGVVKHSVSEEKAGVVYVYDEYEHHQKTPQVAYESDTLAIPMDMSQGSDVEE